MDSSITISKQTQRRFILGKHGLYPGRRWRGKAGVVEALHAGCAVQVDPLNVVARSHDLVLYGRVLDYQPGMLTEVLYTDREGFDWGGAIFVHPMAELPYWRVAMQRKQNEPRWVQFREQNHAVIDEVLEQIRVRGPLSGRDFAGGPSPVGTFRSGKITGLALYCLWLAGELMTHSRRNFDRVYDLFERVAPPHLQNPASTAEAEDFFALKCVQELCLVTAKSWRNWFRGTIERPVEPQEANDRFEALITAGKIAAVTLEGDEKTRRYLLTEDLPDLETLHTSQVPEDWQPLENSTSEEAVFLAPLEIASARGRALPVFGFEYLWEVYKPEAKRRWGYYTLPVLYGDQLVARFDSKLQRSTNTLQVNGFWLEPGTQVDTAFAGALRRGFERFLNFTGAKQIQMDGRIPAEVVMALG